jgi:glycerol-3-phosphate O-acyltransferase
MDRHDPSWQERLAAGPAGASALLASMRPLASQVVVRPFVQAYRIVADVLVDDFELTDRDEIVRRALGLGQQYVAQRRLRSSESVSALLFQTALQLADNKGLLGTGPDVQAGRVAFLAELRALLRRLDEVESIALRRYLKESVTVPLTE